MGKLEKQFRLSAVAQLSGYSISSLRQKIASGRIGHRKTGRIVTVPESEVERLLGEYRPPLEQDESIR